MCAHEDDAIMHYVTECIIASSECATLKDEMSAWAGSKCFIAGHMTFVQLASELILKARRRLARYLVS